MNNAQQLTGTDKSGLIYAALEAFDPNPFLARGEENAEHVRSIADSIRVQGLLQIPAGRAVDGRIQLAFGHTRLAAFRLLAQDETAEAEQRSAFGEMPVIVLDLTDVEMFELAVSENLRRKDLTPIEQARAMLIYREQFGKTSVEIGELFGLSDSAVRNKLRLLELPEDMQRALEDGRITEGMGREILALKLLPAEILKAAEEAYESIWEIDRGDYSKPSTIIEKTLEGKTTLDQLANLNQKIINSYARPMSQAQWKWDQVEEGEEIANPTCKGCPMKIERGSQSYCLQVACFKERDKRFERRYLEAASQASGIPPLEEGREFLTSFENYRNQQHFEAIRARGCSNLRLVYAHTEPYGDGKMQRVDQHPRARVVCFKREGACTCVQGLEVKGTPPQPSPQSSIGEREKEESVSIETVDADERGEMEAKPQPLGEDELRELASATRRQRQQNRNEVRAMLEMATDRIRAGLDADNQAIWRKIALRFWNLPEHKLADLSKYHLKLIIAKGIASRDGYDPEQSYSQLAETDPEQCLEKYNELLEKLGLEKIPNNLPKARKIT